MTSSNVFFRPVLGLACALAAIGGAGACGSSGSAMIADAHDARIEDAPAADAPVDNAPAGDGAADAGGGGDAAGPDAIAPIDGPPGSIPMFVVAGGRFRKMISCDDGKTWIDGGMDTSSAPDEGTGVRGLGYGNGLFVAAVGGGGATGRIFSSTDGLNWTERVPTGTYNGFSQVAFGNGYYVAGGGNNSIRSATGVDGWGDLSSMGNGGILREMVCGDGQFVAVGGGRIRHSADALTWLAQGSGTCADELEGLAFGAGRFVALERTGATCVSTDGGATWTNGTVGTSSNLGGIVYTGHDFLARALSFVFRSTDGITWTSATANGGVPGQIAMSDQGTFVGVQGGDIYRSVDEITWTHPLSSGAGSQSFNRIVFGLGSPSTACPGP